MTIKDYNDPVEIAADDAEDFLDTLIDSLRDNIAARTPATVDSLTDAIMDYFEALPLVQRDPYWMPLMVSILAAAAVRRLAYREEGLTLAEARAGRAVFASVSSDLMSANGCVRPVGVSWPRRSRPAVLVVKGCMAALGAHRQ